VLRGERCDLKDYAAVDHGYAATIHKAQGDRDPAGRLKVCALVSCLGAGH
jgi:hypothetical protein